MINLRKILSFAIPFVLILEHLKDYIQYLRYSGLYQSKRSEKKLLGLMMAEYHVVEKGLTMPEPRLGFGKHNINNLIAHTSKYLRRYGKDNNQLHQCVSVLVEYVEFHTSHNHSLDQNLLLDIKELQQGIDSLERCKQVDMSVENYYSKSEEAFPLFSEARRSVRNYSDESIDIKELKEAVDIARNTPSSCNRQGARVHVFTDKEKISEILTLQGGNRGFGHLADKLIVLTQEQGISHGVYERHQIYVDGGMFAMNLLYALHYKKIVACSLNCNFSMMKERKMRKICNVDSSEMFVMMISCGIAPDNFKIASSKRIPLSNLLTIS